MISFYKNKNIKKTIPLYLLIATTFLGVHFSSSNVAEARYSDLTIAEERVLAQQQLRDAYRELEGKDYQNENSINAIRIYHEIVEANPIRLWFNDGKHPYYLQELRCIDSSIGKIEAFNAGDGIIGITRQHIGQCNGFAPGSMSVNGKGKHKIYNNAVIAAWLAHEIGHWEDNNDKSVCTIEERLRAERVADRLALEYMDGTLFYGYGGCLIGHATRLIGDADDETHPSSAARANMVSNYITTASKNRLKFDKDYRVTLDGKLFNGTGYAPDYDIGKKWPEIRADERTIYVAGQIAFAIKYGVWNRGSLMMQTQQSLFGYGGDTVVLLVKNPKSVESDGLKVIDKFNISYQRASDIIKVVLNHGNVNQLGSLNQEEEYFAYVIRSSI